MMRRALKKECKRNEGRDSRGIVGQKSKRGQAREWKDTRDKEVKKQKVERKKTEKWKDAKETT